MSIETYSELQAAIADLLNRSDLTAQIPNWISLCEAALNRDLDCPQMQVTTTITITGETYPLPADFGGVKSLRINSGAGSPVEYVTPDILDDLAIMTGTPTAYTISGDFFYFNPVPGSATAARLRYRQLVPALSDANPTNWVLTRHSDVYLYGAAMHSAPYLQADDRLSTWAALYRALVSDINNQGRKQAEGSTLQTVSGFYG